MIVVELCSFIVGKKETIPHSYVGIIIKFHIPLQLYFRFVKINFIAKNIIIINTDYSVHLNIIISMIDARLWVTKAITN